MTDEDCDFTGIPKEAYIRIQLARCRANEFFRKFGTLMDSYLDLYQVVPDGILPKPNNERYSKSSQRHLSNSPGDIFLPSWYGKKRTVGGFSRWDILDMS